VPKSDIQKIVSNTFR